MDSLLLVGLLMGMRHAVEADHVAAVASLSAAEGSLGVALRQGVAWGVGHAATLGLFGSIVLFMGREVPEAVTRALEFMVGVMLVLLGLDLLRRIFRGQIHFHYYCYADSKAHFHAHAYPEEGMEERFHHAVPHDNHHPTPFPLRALLVGAMHGMSGSAAVTVLALGTVKSPLQGVFYLTLFGLGSVLGMVLLSTAISLPLQRSAARLGRAHISLQTAIGLFTIGLGAVVIWHNASGVPYPPF